MKLSSCILLHNDCYRAGRTIQPRGVMVHSTGADNPWLSRYVAPDDGNLGENSNGNDWNRPGVGACVHAFIGQLADGSVATYQTLPWNWRGWHAGTGTTGFSANNTHISFEICEDGLDGPDYFNAVYQEAVELTAYLCQLYGLDPLEDGVVICHSEGYRRGVASNHADVMHWFPKHGKSMDTFRADVKSRLGSTAESYRIHTVVHGDTLWDIAVKYLRNGSRYPEIKSLNGLKSNVLYSGMKLKIPN